MADDVGFLLIIGGLGYILAGFMDMKGEDNCSTEQIEAPI